VKKAVETFAANYDASDSSLSDQILKVAGDISRPQGLTNPLLVGITAIAFMTIQQAGWRHSAMLKVQMLLDRKGFEEISGAGSSRACRG